MASAEVSAASGNRQQPPAFAVLLQLERAARRAQTPAALHYTMVNETARLVAFRQAVLARSDGRVHRALAVSGVAVIDRSTPYLHWLESVLTTLADRVGDATAPQPFTVDDLPEALRLDAAQWCAAHLLWCPLVAPDGQVLGVLWLTRPMPWDAAEIRLLQPLLESYAHAWRALVGPRRLPRGRRWPRWPLMLAVLSVVVAALALLSVPQSVLAPAEVVGRDPQIVAAPLDGVIARFAVRPNQPVTVGTELFRFDDTVLRSRRDIAQQTLAIAEAELRRARQGAFADRESAAQVALLEARVRQREAELALAESRLTRAVVTAPRDGVAVFADARAWIGRPVQTGERVLEVADPRDVELTVWLPVGEVLALPSGARVQLFLDADPLTPVIATLEHVAWRADPTPDGRLAYRLTARFADDQPPPRLGLRGTAKVSGEDVPLAYVLLRRPLSALRQTLGI